MKVLVALTGLAMVGFVVAHLTGNLLIFAGPESLNKYAQSLRDLGALLWIARIGLIASVAGHIALTLKLTARNNAARPERYVAQKPVNSTIYSRTMTYTGLGILGFVVFHLLHYTFGKIQPAEYNNVWILNDGRTVHDVYSMVVAGFSNPIYTGVYIVCVTFVLMHLSHAIASSIQTLGFNHPRYYSQLKNASNGLSLILWIGYVSIPLAVLLKYITPLG